MSVRRDYTAGAHPGAVSRADSAPDWLGCGEPRRPDHFGDGRPSLWNSGTISRRRIPEVLCRSSEKALRVLNRRSADRYLTAAGFENNDTGRNFNPDLVHIPPGASCSRARKSGDRGQLSEFELFRFSREVLRAPNPESSLVGN